MVLQKLPVLSTACLLLALNACSSGAGGANHYATSADSDHTFSYRHRGGTSYRQGTAHRDNQANFNQADFNQAGFNQAGFRQWQDTDPQYRLLPGDQLDIIVYSAPELSRLLLVGPDGRVQMPLAPAVMAANLTIEQLETNLETALASQLIDPNVEITPRGFGSQRIFVGGQVSQPGIFELPGQIGVLEAVMMAGGPLETATTRKVVVVRRHPGGGTMMKVVNINDVIHRGGQGDRQPLQRGDVIVVPRSNIAKLNLFIRQYIRDALPISFGLTYDLSGNSSN